MDLTYSNSEVLHNLKKKRKKGITYILIRAKQSLDEIRKTDLFNSVLKKKIGLVSTLGNF